jgi:hypothetical protein
MKLRLTLGLLVLAAVLALPPAAPGLARDTAAGDYPFDLAKVVQRSVASIAPVGGRIDIASTSAVERYPQVAVCASNQYLVVYQHSAADAPYSIYGQRLTGNGQLLGAPFEIDLQANKAFQADVACEWSNDHFVVVWTYDYAGDDSDHDVYARSVYGSHQAGGQQLVSGLVPVSQDLTYETQPAIACNSDDASCLVVYDYLNAGDSEIYGRRLVVTGPGIGTYGDPFNISQQSTADRIPDVAWGPLDHNYLVSWEHYHTIASASTWIVMSSLVYDTEQGPPPADQRQTAPRFLIDPNVWFNTQMTSAVAYNRRGSSAGRYLVVFRSVPYDIAARRVKATDGTAEGDRFFVAQHTDQVSSPAVAFSGGPEDSGAGANQFLVTYLKSDGTVDTAFLHGQSVKGSHAATGSQLDGPAFEIARSTYSTEDAELERGGVTGSAHNGRYMAVWGDRDTAGTDSIRGQLYSPYGVYLPVVLRNH